MIDMDLVERIAGILDDRDVRNGQLRVLVNDATNVVTITINPSSKKPDHYQVINMEEDV